ncbi:hypothetical protein TD95_000112 [Thielaviopsis punctulata]|uniref:FAR1 domain-containing protein n=1 Tax=Thielaviopsis punctulata TaxID=72032 RepID=A0A0F4Z788_9PEZI|nr:hypothetical protein TD95_000112 [Thielaviopsis punctulata]
MLHVTIDPHFLTSSTSPVFFDSRIYAPSQTQAPAPTAPQPPQQQVVPQGPAQSAQVQVQAPPQTVVMAEPAVMPNAAPQPALLPPPEGIYRSFEDLLSSVQRIAKDQGYGVVKLRASNYRDGRPTRYDLVCDRGGVKYNSTAKKRNPSTRKIDCPWRAKAVCEVQLGNQWRFAVQEPRHNHEPRVPTLPPGQENSPLAQSLRSFTNKLDRITHDLTQGLMRIESRLDQIEKRLDGVERGMTTYEPRFQNIDSRMQSLESRSGGIELGTMDEVESRLLASSVM